MLCPRSFPMTASFLWATVKRLCSCATEAAHNASILSSSRFSNRKIRQRVSRARIVQDGPSQALELPEVRWKKPIGITSQRNDLQARLPKHSIAMPTPISSRGSSSLLLQRYWANFARHSTPSTPHPSPPRIPRNCRRTLSHKPQRHPPPTPPTYTNITHPFT